MIADFIQQEQAALVQELNSVQERILLLARYQELSRGLVPQTVVPTAKLTTAANEPAKVQTVATVTGVVGEKKTRGRPKGSKNKPKVDGVDEATGVSTGDGKSIDLPTLLETIGQEVNKPMTLADFVTLVLNSGYKTKAKDVSNMVYQALHKLTKRGTFVKNNETRAYEFVQKAA